MLLLNIFEWSVRWKSVPKIIVNFVVIVINKSEYYFIKEYRKCIKVVAFCLTQAFAVFMIFRDLKSI